MAAVIQAGQRPSLIISHNKTLAGQLYDEFDRHFPHNAVRKFISDYLYFVPQTYRPRSDRYNDKRAVLDDVLTRQRNAAAMSALGRRDVIVVASVSCIFDIGPPQVCRDLALPMTVGASADVASIVAQLVKIRYHSADIKLEPKTFRVRGRYVEVFPLYENHAYRVEVQNGAHVSDPWRSSRKAATQSNSTTVLLSILRVCICCGMVGSRRPCRKSRKNSTGGCKNWKAGASGWKPNGWKRQL